MKKTTYCYWLLASTVAGIKLNDEERKTLQTFMSQDHSLAR